MLRGSAKRSHNPPAKAMQTHCRSGGGVIDRQRIAFDAALGVGEHRLLGGRLAYRHRKPMRLAGSATAIAAGLEPQITTCGRGSTGSTKMSMVPWLGHIFFATRRRLVPRRPCGLGRPALFGRHRRSPQHGRGRRRRYRAFVTVDFRSTVAEGSQSRRFYRAKLHSIQPRSSRGDQMGRSRERPFFVPMPFVSMRVR